MAWTALVLALSPSLCLAASQCRESGGWRDQPAQLNLRLDNDALGNASQDHGYSNGLALTGVSPNLAGHAQDPCLPRLARGLNRYLDWAHPAGFEQQYLVLGMSHGLYTPDDKTRGDLIVEDRPYAAVAMLSLGYHARNGDALHSTQLRLGMVGPSARGQDVQDAVHALIDVRRAQGWQHQLRDEPLLQLVHERLHRWTPPGRENADGWGWDAIGHAGGSLGNLATHANAGGELRLGWRVADDFGSTPLRAVAGTAPARHAPGDGQWSWHAFLSVDGRWVLRDLTLDGNSFKPSHRVDKRALVGDLGYGLSLNHGRWIVTLAQYQRSREFEGQDAPPAFGSLSVTHAF